MSLNNEEMYSTFILEKGFEGRKKSVKKERFLKIASELNDPEFIRRFSSREEARVALRQKASGSLGILGFFILKAVVHWIIDKILDYYFS